MNYYIQGDAANADKIKAAFKELGIVSNADRYNYKNDNVLYFTAGGMIHMIDAYGSWANIIKTHPDYEELELPVEPKFKVGDKIQAKDSKMYVYTVLSVDLQNQKYIIEHNYKHQLLFTKQDDFELVPPKPHYDIANFKPFDKVLVRCHDGWNWECNLFSRYEHRLQNPFITCNSSYPQCIPFEGNEHLLGTTDMCSEEYINW